MSIAPNNAQAGVQRARVEGASAERARIATILNHAEAKGRLKQARHLAFESDLTVEQAVRMLAASGQETPVGNYRGPLGISILGLAPVASGAAGSWDKAIERVNAKR